MSEKRYVLKKQRIKDILQERGYSQRWLSRMTGHMDGWLADQFRKNTGVTQEQAEKIALLLDKPFEDIAEVLQEHQEPKPSDIVKGVPRIPDYSKEFSEMYLMQKKMLEEINRISETQEALYNKANAIVKQICRIQDKIDKLGQPDKLLPAKQFLTETLKGGRMKVSTIKEDATALNISTDDLLRAKKELYVKAETSGFGTNRETYWYL